MKKLTRFERYLTVEIGIEFKACLYFFCFLFFYSVYRITQGNFEASILHMTEMILATYGMGYVQIYLLANFDEAEHFGKREFCYSLLCSIVYALIAHFGNWFDGKLFVVGIFWAYAELACVCTYFVYKVKRDIDTRILNADLKTFQQRREGMEENGNNN